MAACVGGIVLIFSLLQYYKDSAWWISEKGLTRFAFPGDGSITNIELENCENGVDEQAFPNSSETGVNRLLADNKLFAMPLSEPDSIDTAGVLYCWNLEAILKN